MNTPRRSSARALLDSVDDTQPLSEATSTDNDVAKGAAGRRKEKKPVKEHDARQAIVVAALKAATTTAIRRRLHGRKPLAVVIEIPGSDWVKPFEDYFDSAQSENWATFARGGKRGSRQEDIRWSQGRRHCGESCDHSSERPDIGSRSCHQDCPSIWRHGEERDERLPFGAAARKNRRHACCRSWL
jgi:hypothetical protein